MRHKYYPTGGRRYRKRIDTTEQMQSLEQFAGFSDQDDTDWPSDESFDIECLDPGSAADTIAEPQAEYQASENAAVKAMMASNHPLRPVTEGPPPVPELPLSVNNAFRNLSAPKIPIEDVLEFSPSPAHQSHLQSLASEVNQWHKKKIIHRMLWLSLNKNLASTAVIERAELLRRNEWPISMLPEEVKRAQNEWLAWIVGLDNAMEGAMRQARWHDVLEREYENAEDIWSRFWKAQQKMKKQRKKGAPSGVLLTELDEVCRELAEHNCRRAWVMQRIGEGIPGLYQGVFADMPVWYNWEHIVPQILRSGVEPDSDCEDEDEDEELDALEKRFVEELDDAE